MRVADRLSPTLRERTSAWKLAQAFLIHHMRVMAVSIDFCVTGRPKVIAPSPSSCGLMSDVVVDLAVVHETMARPAVPHRLSTTRIQIDQGETTVSESKMLLGVHSGVVKVAMLQCCQRCSQSRMVRHSPWASQRPSTHTVAACKLFRMDRCRALRGDCSQFKRCVAATARREWPQPSRHPQQ